MDTRTGEVFNLDEHGDLVRGPVQEQADYLAQQLRLDEARRRGELAPIGDDVVQLVRDGERMQRRRRRRRKAQRAARKGNRGA